MEISELIQLLKKACEGESLRKVAKRCGVSHETIRHLINENELNVSISLNTFRKIEKGVK